MSICSKALVNCGGCQPGCGPSAVMSYGIETSFRTATMNTRGRDCGKEACGIHQDRTKAIPSRCEASPHGGKIPASARGENAVDVLKDDQPRGATARFRSSISFQNDQNVPDRVRSLSCSLPMPA